LFGGVLVLTASRWPACCFVGRVLTGHCRRAAGSFCQPCMPGLRSHRYAAPTGVYLLAVPASSSIGRSRWRSARYAGALRTGVVSWPVSNGGRIRPGSHRGRRGFPLLRPPLSMDTTMTTGSQVGGDQRPSARAFA
jgi:hypothetical protein